MKSSGYRGVTYEPDQNRWVAWAGGERRMPFPDERTAVLARRAMLQFKEEGLPIPSTPELKRWIAHENNGGNLTAVPKHVPDRVRVAERRRVMARD